MKLESALQSVPKKYNFFKSMYASIDEMPTSPRAISVLVNLGKPWEYLTQNLCAISSFDKFMIEISFQSSHATMLLGEQLICKVSFQILGLDR